MNKYKSEALEALHELMSDIHKAGGISDERMRFYDEGCLAKSTPAGERASIKKSTATRRSGVSVYACEK